MNIEISAQEFLQFCGLAENMSIWNVIHMPCLDIMNENKLYQIPKKKVKEILSNLLNEKFKRKHKINHCHCLVKKGYLSLPEVVSFKIKLQSRRTPS
jgi:hypothetical protein